METTASILESLFERVETYSKTTYELSKLKLLKTTIVVVTALTHKLSVIFALSMFALVVNIGLALYLGEILGKIYYGFFIVGGFYLVVGLLLHFLIYKWLRKQVSDIIIKQALQ